MAYMSYEELTYKVNTILVNFTMATVCDSQYKAGALLLEFAENLANHSHADNPRVLAMKAREVSRLSVVMRPGKS